MKKIAIVICLFACSLLYGCGVTFQSMDNLLDNQPFEQLHSEAIGALETLKNKTVIDNSKSNIQISGNDVMSNDRNNIERMISIVDKWYNRIMTADIVKDTELSEKFKGALDNIASDYEVCEQLATWIAPALLTLAEDYLQYYDKVSRLETFGDSAGNKAKDNYIAFSKDDIELGMSGKYKVTYIKKDELHKVGNKGYEYIYASNANSYIDCYGLEVEGVNAESFPEFHQTGKNMNGKIEKYSYSKGRGSVNYNDIERLMRLFAFEKVSVYVQFWDNTNGMKVIYPDGVGKKKPVETGIKYNLKEEYDRNKTGKDITSSWINRDVFYSFFGGSQNKTYSDRDGHKRILAEAMVDAFSSGSMSYNTISGGIEVFFDSRNTYTYGNGVNNKNLHFRVVLRFHYPSSDEYADYSLRRFNEKEKKKKNNNVLAYGMVPDFKVSGNDDLKTLLSKIGFSTTGSSQDMFVNWFMQMFSGKLRVINSNNITNVRMPSDDNTSYENSVVTIDEIKNIIENYIEEQSDDSVNNFNKLFKTINVDIDLADGFDSSKVITDNIKQLKVGDFVVADFHGSMISNEFIERVMASDSQDNCSYLFTVDSKNNKYINILTYDIGYIDSFNADTSKSGAAKYYGTVKDSGMTYNIMDGNIYLKGTNGITNYDTSLSGWNVYNNAVALNKVGSNSSNSSLRYTNGAPGLSVTVSQNIREKINETGKSNLINKDLISKFVIREYFEGTYMPNIVANEDILVLGRTIGMTNEWFSGNNDMVYRSTVGYIRTKNSNYDVNDAILVADLIDMKTDGDTVRTVLKNCDVWERDDGGTGIYSSTCLVGDSGHVTFTIDTVNSSANKIKIGYVINGASPGEYMVRVGGIENKKLYVGSSYGTTTIDVSGNLNESVVITITSIPDEYGNTAEYASCQFKKVHGQIQEQSTVKGVKALTDGVTESNAGGGIYDESRIETLPINYIKTISTGELKSRSTMNAYNSNVCASWETDMSERLPKMFVIATSHSVTSLMNSWVYDNEDLDNNGNLTQWVTWLRSVGYKSYLSGWENGVPTDLINSIVKKLYNFSIGDASSSVQLDINIISGIQDKIDKDHLRKEAGMIRSICLIVGVLCTMYGMLLVIAWLVDNGVHGEGDGMLYKVTFGKCKTATGLTSEEADKMGDGSVRYLTIGSVAFRGFILISLGIILFAFDAIGLASKLIESVSWITDSIRKLIFNSK